MEGQHEYDSGHVAEQERYDREFRGMISLSFTQGEADAITERAVRATERDFARLAEAYARHEAARAMFRHEKKEG